MRDSVFILQEILETTRKQKGIDQQLSLAKAEYERWEAKDEENVERLRALRRELQEAIEKEAT